MTMEKERNTPSIRFKGFTDPWEQQKLNNLCELITKQTGFDYSATIKPSLVREKKTGVYPFIQNKDFSGNNINLDTDFYIPIEVAEKFPRILLDKPSLLISISGRIGNVGLYNLPQKSFIGGAVGICKLKDHDVGEFVVQELESEYGQRYFQSLIKASSHANITVEDIRNIELNMPSTRNERQKISDFFLNLDILITLHQRKLDREKRLKEYLLQNMFPREGENVPRIRFPGFTDPWEQRKLSEIATMHARIGWQNLRTSEFLDDGDYYLITGTDFTDGRIDFSHCHYVAKERYEQDKNIQIRNGSILITKDGTLGKVAYVSGLNKPATLNAGVFNVVIKDDEIDEKYLYQYLAGHFLMDYVSQRATGGTIKHLNQNILIDFPVLLSSYEEQKQIGSALENIDNLITLHQQKLESLKELKKGLLQKMFV